MPKLWKTLTKNMESGETYLYSELMPLVSGRDYAKTLTLFLKSAGSGTFNIKISIYNGYTFTDYYSVKDPEGNETFTIGNSLSFNLRDQDWWLDSIGGMKILLTRVSGSGTITFSNGYIYATF